MLNPYTDAYYRSTPPLVEQSPPLMQAPGGTFDVDVRNADGLIVASDLDTGFWAFTAGRLFGMARPCMGLAKHVQCSGLGRGAGRQVDPGYFPSGAWARRWRKNPTAPSVESLYLPCRTGGDD